MKKFESFILYVFVVVFIYFFIALIARMVLPMEGMIVKTLKINGFYILGPCIMSALLSCIFPMWSVSKYLNTQNVKVVMNFTRTYKLQYINLCFGFLGIACLAGSKAPDPAGIFFVCCGFVIIFSSVFSFITVRSNLRKKSK